MRRFATLFASTVALALLLITSGCGGGSDGSDGAPGPQGPPGPQLPATALESCEVCHGEGRVADLEVAHGLVDSPFAVTPDITSLTTTFNSVTVNDPGTTVLNLSFADQNGDPVTGLTTTNVFNREIRFTIARLYPSAAGDASYWMSYVYSSGGSPTYDRSGTLVETGTAGTYDFTFSVDISAGATAPNAVTVPTAVTYDANATHRIGMQTGGGSSILPASNATHTFVPAIGGGDGTGVTVTRDMVETATCNECHGDLVIHGRRRDTNYCVTCHNPGLPDADFKEFIHKIHRGRYLPSVVAGGTYEVGGHDYTHVGFPMFPLSDGAGIQNCSKCHDGSNTNTPDGDNWKSVPTAEACGSCHDDVNFTTGANHTAGARTNAECATCHGSSSTYAPAVVHNRAANSGPGLIADATATLQYVISSATYSTLTGQLTVEFSVVDPTDSNAPYDLNPTTGDDPFTSSGSSLNLSVAWDASKDFTNRGTTSTPASVLSVNVLSEVGAGNITADGTGTYTAVITMPNHSWASGSGMVYLQGHPVGDLDGDGTFSDRLPVPSVSATFAMNDASPTARRAIVDIDLCNECHGTLSLHGSNRTDNIEVCASCHNPSNTDISRRPSDATATADGKAEESIDFKRMIHAIHGAARRENPIVVYGFGGSEHVYDEEEIAYPGVLNNCQTCHLADTYTVPLASYVQGSTISTGSDLADQGDDPNISPTAAVCSSCHDTGTAQGHMEQNGASWEVMEANITTF